MAQHKEHNNIARIYSELKAFVTKNNIVVYTAIQAKNPNARVYDIMDFAPNLIVMDYCYNVIRD